MVTTAGASTRDGGGRDDGVIFEDNFDDAAGLALSKWESRRRSSAAQGSNTPAIIVDQTEVRRQRFLCRSTRMSRRLVTFGARAYVEKSFASDMATLTNGIKCSFFIRLDDEMVSNDHAT